MRRTLMRPLQALPGAFGNVAVLVVQGELDKTHNGVERGAQFVTHMGEKARFMLLGDFELGDRMGEFLGARLHLEFEIGVGRLQLLGHAIEGVC